MSIVSKALLALAIALATVSLSSAQVDALDANYPLSVGDKVLIEVYNQADWRTTQEIDTQGNVRMKLIGPVKVAGLSTRAAEKAIETQYVAQRYLRAPDVSVQISAYSSKPVVVRGAVNRPGLVELDRYPRGLDIYRVIAMAGGLRDVAKESAIRVIRRDAKGESQVLAVDLSAGGRKRGEPGFERFTVLPYDVIEIGETRF